jgi:5-methylcytosine-specific restriction endonuclease McrA
MQYPWYISSRIDMAAAFKVRKRLIARRDGGYYCVYCGIDGTRKELTVDHVIPRSKGGGSKRENLVLSCRECNNIKGDDIWKPVFREPNNRHIFPLNPINTPDTY